MDYDVAVIGGGPAGSTFGSILKKYRPDSRVVILERERFPREHVGESQLPPITLVLEEMGCWDKVEAMGFPVKTGALYRWGNSDDLWRFDFLVGQEFADNPRPEPLAGQRYQTTFHVDRAIFDELLLNHAAHLGCEVHQEAPVAKVHRSGDRVTGLELRDGREFKARHYIDASGHPGLLRRAMGVPVSEPTALKNIAIWRYWRREAWAAMDGVGCGGVRVRVLSINNGWIWFIPIGPDRASVGFVTQAEHYRRSGLSIDELYAQALAAEPTATSLLAGAEHDREIRTTKDWSFLAERMAGENWMLVGESAGFADPILAGGMTLAMVGAREAAYIHAALLEGEQDEAWLKDWYGESQTRRISQHIKFADYWYSANGHFSELKEYTSEIAAEAGLELAPEEAFRWLGTGGFVSDDLARPEVGTYRLGAVKSAMQILTGMPASWELNRYNDFTINLDGCEVVHLPYCRDGRIERVKCFRRGRSLLPMLGAYRQVYRALAKEHDAAGLVRLIKQQIAASPEVTEPYNAFLGVIDVLEGMLAEGWITATVRVGRPFMNVSLDEASFSMVGR